jgi:hypothetical protein
MTPAADQKKIDLIQTHAQSEWDKNWDGALATMIDQPAYEYYPYRLRVSGEVAIKEMWERTLILPCLNYATGRKVIGKERYINENSVVDVIQNTFADDESGEQVYSKFLCIFHFDDEDKIITEAIHLDQNMTPYFDAVFKDPEFLALPGVEQF